MATAKLRIAVAIDPTGKWYAYGWSKSDDQEMMDNAIDGVGEGEARYFVNAEVEIPELVTGEVTGSADKAVA